MSTESTWIDCIDRLPTKADAKNRMEHVFWLVCDGFVCEPLKAKWDWKPSPAVAAVAWMPIPSHPKFYSAID